jgi:hypothetical protein
MEALFNIKETEKDNQDPDRTMNILQAKLFFSEFVIMYIRSTIKKENFQ